MSFILKSVAVLVARGFLAFRCNFNSSMVQCLENCLLCAYLIASSIQALLPQAVSNNKKPFRPSFDMYSFVHVDG